MTGAPVLELARQVLRRDAFAVPLRTVAGLRLDREAGALVTASIVLLDAGSLVLLDARQVDAAGMDEPTVLTAAVGALRMPPDLVFVRGHGMAHPQRLGLASRLGLLADVPAIGVDDTALLGTAAALHEIRGAHTPLRDGREQIGWLLRSRPGAAPLVVSPGHRVSMTAAAQLTMRFVTGDRLPEPIRLANPEAIAHFTAIGRAPA